MSKEINQNEIKEYFEKLKIDKLELKPNADKYLMYAELAEFINLYNSKDDSLKNYLKIWDIFESNDLSSSEFVNFIHEFSIKYNKKDSEQVILEKTYALLANLKKEAKVLGKSIKEQTRLASKNLRIKALELGDDIINDRTEVQKTMKQVSKIVNVISDVHKASLNGKKGHDLLMGALAVGTTALSTASYVGAKATLKLSAFTLKTVGKLALKSTAKLGKLSYKGTKKGLKFAIKKSEERRTNKANRVAVNGKKISRDLVKYLSSELTFETVKDSKINDITKRDNIHKIRQWNFDGKDEFQDELLQENKTTMDSIRTKLYGIKNQKIYMELSSKFGLSEQETIEFLNNIALDEYGDLSIPKNLSIKKEDIENTDLEVSLRNIVQMPKIDDLTDSQVRLLVKSLSIENDEIKFNLPEDLNRSDNILIDIANSLQGKEFYVKGMETFVDKLNEDCKISELNVELLEEIRLRDELDIAVELDNQMSIILEQITEINLMDKKDIFDKEKRNDLRRIAEEKVKALEKARIIRTIEDGKNKTQKLVYSARDILLPLREVKDIGDKEIEKLADDKVQE